jgi:hypothetical protein
MRLLVITFILLLGACSSVRVVFDKEVNFDNYTSFICVECEDDYSEANTEHDNADYRALIRGEITKALKAKGLQYNTENPDLLVDFKVVIEEHTAVLGNPQTMYDYWETYKYPTGKFRKQILLVNLIDASSQKAIWQGMASNLIDEDKEKINAKTKRSILKMFKNFKSSKN